MVFVCLPEGNHVLQTPFSDTPMRTSPTTVFFSTSDSCIANRWWRCLAENRVYHPSSAILIRIGMINQWIHQPALDGEQCSLFRDLRWNDVGSTQTQWELTIEFWRWKQMVWTYPRKHMIGTYCWTVEVSYSFIITKPETHLPWSKDDIPSGSLW